MLVISVVRFRRQIQGFLKGNPQNVLKTNLDFKKPLRWENRHLSIPGSVAVPCSPRLYQLLVLCLQGLQPGLEVYV